MKVIDEKIAASGKELLLVPRRRPPQETNVVDVVAMLQESLNQRVCH